MNQENWYYRLNDQQVGPVSQDEIIRLFLQRTLTADSYVWTEGMQDWQPISQVPAFAAFTTGPQSGQRPTSVTVLGILNIVFGGLGLTCIPIGIAMSFVPQPDSPFQPTEAMELFTMIGNIVGFLFSIVLLASGIGLLYQKKWARKTSIIYGWTAIVWCILGLIINGFLFSSMLSDVPPEAMPGVVGGIVGGMCGGLIGLAYPIILIIFMRKPHVIEACSR